VGDPASRTWEWIILGAGDPVTRSWKYVACICSKNVPANFFMPNFLNAVFSALKTINTFKLNTTKLID
jgi:hypothetical protein